MGSLRVRKDKRGRTRYQALYRDLKGRLRSAGTFSTDKQANKAWQRAEAQVEAGRLGDPRRGRQTFRRYVEQTWLPNHELELKSRERYTYSIHKHLMPFFGGMRMIDILPEQVREWVTQMKENGATPATIASNKTILSAVFTTALNDQVVFLHPCKGVKTPPVPKKPRRIITPEQFDTVYQGLPNADAQLLVETDIETGLRWGELSELRPKDLDTTTGILTVSRAVVEVNPKFHPNGKRFFVKDYPKDKEYRRFKVSRQLVKKIEAHIDAEALSPNDLLFAFREDDVAELPPAPPDSDTLGRTEPNAAGRTYKHGTISGYSLGQCKCQYCRGAYARYRAERRAAGKDNPRNKRTRDTDGHIPADWFRKRIWYPTLVQAGFRKGSKRKSREADGSTAARAAETTEPIKDVSVRIQDLRHAHASWLLAGGADIQVVKERLGHGSLRTTETYLHTLPEADETALAAFAKVRNRDTSTASE